MAAGIGAVFVADFRDSTDLVTDFSSVIVSAAQSKGVDPVVLSAVIFHEARSWNRAGGLGDRFLLAIRGDDSFTSVGIGQMNLATAKRLEGLGYLPALSNNDATIAALLNDESAVEYSAAYLQYLGDQIDGWFSARGVSLDDETRDRLMMLGYNQGWDDPMTARDLLDQLNADSTGAYEYLAQQLAYGGRNAEGVFLNDYVYNRVWTVEQISRLEEILGVTYGG